MTNIERTTTREATRSEPVARTHASASAPTRSDLATVHTTELTRTASGPGGMTVAARIVVFVFGVLQAALILRIILLALVANPGNDIVALILDLTAPFVEPFVGMFAIDRVSADQGSVLDIAAIVALIGWTLVEALILAALRVFDRRVATIA